LLALVTVDTLEDTFIYNDGVTSLREAIFATNVVDGADTIEFASSLFAGGLATILLTQGDLEITEALEINGPGANLLSIDANQASRIFNITATSGDFLLTGLTLTGGKTVGDNVLVGGFPTTTFNGGAVRSVTDGNLTFNQCIIIGNHTTGRRARGGGVFARNVTLIQSTVSGNSTEGDSSIGGGISAQSNVTLTQSTVSGNSTIEDAASGGGISAFSVTATQSAINGNWTLGIDANGGGIRASNVTLMQSTVSGNRTEGNQSIGGGIDASLSATLFESAVSGNLTAGNNADGGGIRVYTDLTLTRSTVSGNSTTGTQANGGGIRAQFSTTIIITESTVSGNTTSGINSRGGGIYADLGFGQNPDGVITLTQSTFSGNSTAGFNAAGGGIYKRGPVSLIRSTFTDNHTLGAFSDGGGIFLVDSSTDNPSSISGSILSGNMATGVGADLVPDPQSALSVNYSLIGSGIVPTGGGNNVVTNSPQLGLLAENGGPTMTRPPLAGSPAIDTGDPSGVVPPYDQRGNPFNRIVGLGIDIGAVERQPIPSAVNGDYNQNGVVEAADYVVWRKMFGTTVVSPHSGADGNGNSEIESGDYDVWQENFGEAQPGSGGAAVSEALGTWSVQAESSAISAPWSRESGIANFGLTVAQPREAIAIRRSRFARDIAMTPQDDFADWLISLTGFRTVRAGQVDNDVLEYRARQATREVAEGDIDAAFELLSLT
jgi:hypothetical protein